MSYEIFVVKLQYFGGRITVDGSITSKEYIDIEKFFIEATNYMSVESRVTRCMESWVYKFGSALSPSKLRRILKSDVEYNKAVLGVFIKIIESNNTFGSNFDILIPFVKKEKKLKKLFDLPFKLRKYDKNWIAYNIQAPVFELELEKYLRPISYIKKNVVELWNRLLGLSQVEGDVLAILKKKLSISPFAISKLISTNHSRVYKILNRFRCYEVC